MIASAEAVILSLLAGPTALFLVWRWSVFSSRLSGRNSSPEVAHDGEFPAEQFNEDNPGYRPGRGAP
jgi:hypothetical protein